MFFLYDLSSSSGSSLCTAGRFMLWLCHCRAAAARHCSSQGAKIPKMYNLHICTLRMKLIDDLDSFRPMIACILNSNVFIGLFLRSSFHWEGTHYYVIIFCTIFPSIANCAATLWRALILVDWKICWKREVKDTTEWNAARRREKRNERRRRTPSSPTSERAVGIWHIRRQFYEENIEILV